MEYTLYVTSTGNSNPGSLRDVMSTLTSETYTRDDTVFIEPDASFTEDIYLNLTTNLTPGKTNPSIVCIRANSTTGVRFSMDFRRLAFQNVDEGWYEVWEFENILFNGSNENIVKPQ